MAKSIASFSACTRSPFRVHDVFAALLAMNSLLTPVSAATPRDTPTISFPTAGVACAEPDRWTIAQRLPEDAKTVVWLVPASANPAATEADPPSLIRLEALRPAHAGDDARSVAALLAGEWGGTVDPAQTSLDGTPAFWVNVPANAPHHVHVDEAVVALHDGLLYVVMGGCKPGGPDTRSAVDSIRSTWKWIAVDPPDKHLAFADDPVVICKRTISVRVPAHAHAEPEWATDQTASYVIYDLRLGRQAFVAFIQNAAVPAGTDWAKIESGLSRGAADRPQLTHPLMWRTIDGPVRRRVSDWVPIAGGDNGKPASAAYGLVQLDPDHLAALHFTVRTSDAGALQAYGALVERMVASVRTP